MNRTKISLLLLFLSILLLLTACGSAPAVSETEETPQASETVSDAQPAEPEPALTPEPNVKENDMLYIQIGNTQLKAVLEDNPSAQALKELLAEGEVTVQVRNYGGFEKVGTLPQSLPREDVQQTTASGDIMLYQGDSIVLFYGANSWAYTKLGRILDPSGDELGDILGGEDTTLVLSLSEE